MRTLASLSCLVLVAACSGSSRTPPGSTAPVTNAVNLVFDTGASVSFELMATFDVVALEADDGTITPNLLAAQTTVYLAEPDARAAAIELRDVPSGVYHAILLMASPNGVVMRQPLGPWAPVRVGTPLRIPLVTPTSLPSGDDWVVIRHRDPPVVGQGFNGLEWNADLEARPRDLLPLYDLRTRVLGVDRARATVSVEVPDWGDATTSLRFDVAAALRLGGNRVSTAEFLAALRLGDEIAIDGLVEGQRRIWVLAASDDITKAPGHGGNKSEVLAVITSVDPALQKFDARLLRIRKLGNGVPLVWPTGMHVVFDAKSLLHWNPRWGGGPAPVAFSALQPGQQVEIEWHGPALAGEIVAHKVDITAGGPGRHHVSLSGRVQSATPARGEIVVTNAAGFTIGKATYPQVIAVVEPGSVLVRRQRTGLVRITLAEVAVDEPIWVLGRPNATALVRATVVVVGAP